MEDDQSYKDVLAALVVLFQVALITPCRAEEPKSNLLGPIAFGPAVSVSIPFLINLGGEVRISDYFGLGFNYGFHSTFDRTDEVVWSDYEIRLQYFPFGGIEPGPSAVSSCFSTFDRCLAKGFFVGASSGKVTRSSPTLVGVNRSFDPSIDLSALYIAPTIGWRLGGRQGLVLGLDFGWQIPIKATGGLVFKNADKNSIQESTIQDVNASADADAKTLYRYGLPLLTAFHVSYLF